MRERAFFTSPLAQPWSQARQLLRDMFIFCGVSIFFVFVDDVMFSILYYCWLTSISFSLILKRVFIPISILLFCYKLFSL